MSSLHPRMVRWVDEVYSVVDTFLEQVSTPAFSGFDGLSREIVHNTRERVIQHPDHTALALLLYTAEAAGTSLDSAIQLGAGFELAGIAARLLDECIDHDTDDALWTKLGLEQTILLANGLTALGLLLVGHLRDVGIPAALVAQLQNEFELTWFRMCQGQHKELIVSSDHVSENDYWDIAGGKAGQLFTLACKAPAMLTNSSLVEAYSAFGYNFGILIQITNDLQGLQNRRGKRDIGQRLTLPIIHALLTLPSADRSRLERLLREAAQDEGAIAPARTLIEQSKALQYALVQAYIYRTRAAQSLDPCPPLLLKLLDIWFPYSEEAMRSENV